MSKTSEETLIPTTIHDAKKTVYAKLCENINPREISQIAFLINDKVTRFNPAQIRQIREELEPKLTENHLDHDKSHAFKLFKDHTPTEVVIETGLSVEYVKNAYKEYLQFEGKTVISQGFENEIYHNAWQVDDSCETENDVIIALRKLVSSYKELESHTYNCSRCDTEIPIRNKSLQDAKQYLSEKWHHTECP